MAPSRRKAASLLSLLLLATPILAKYSNDFSYYPNAAQPCLYSASNSSQCDGDNVSEMNKCLCSDSKGKFVTNIAKCLGKDAKSSASEVYSDLKTSCANSNTPLSMSEDDFNKLVAVGTTSTSTSQTPKPTTLVTTTTSGATISLTSTPSPTQSNSAEASSGLSTTAKIGIGVGGGFGAVAIVGVIAFVWRLKRSRAAYEESRPMLGSGIGPTAYNPHNSPSASAVAFGLYDPHENKADIKNPVWRPTTDITPSPSPGAQTWATYSPQPPYAPHPPPPQLQQQQHLHTWGHHLQAAYSPPGLSPQPGVFELASMPVQASHPPPPPGVVEMPATEVQPQAPRYHYPMQR